MATQPLDAVIRHSVALQHLSNGQVRRLMATLNRADAEIFARLLELLDRLPEGSATGDYLWELMASIRQLNAAAYQQLDVALTASLKELASVEAGFQYSLYTSQQVPVAAITAEQAWAAAYSRPFAGRLLREALVELGETRAKRIRDAVRMGFLTGKTVAQIVRDIRGTRAKGFVDGFVEVDRRSLEAIVDTAVKHTAASVRNRFMQANADVLGNLRWISTLDGSTSPMCRIRDGLTYTNAEHPKPVGHKVPWGAGPGGLHWRCRSTALALLRGQRKLYGTRASQDGQIDANETYSQWIKRQPASVQDEVLGPTRGKLFRANKIEMDRFYNDKGVWLDLQTLRERDASMFKAAGL